LQYLISKTEKGSQLGAVSQLRCSCINGVIAVAVTLVFGFVRVREKKFVALQR
jgi:hypothetical protein